MALAERGGSIAVYVVMKARRPDSCPKTSCPARRYAASSLLGPDMSRRALAWLIAGAAAATACYFLVARPPGNASYLVFYLGTPAVGVAFLAAGLAAWLRWPSSRLGPLFSLVGYFTLLPALDYLDNSVGFTIGNAAVSLAGAALAHLGLAWPTGRLRSRFERGVVVAEYASAAGLSLLGMLFWDPAFSGCDASCPANLLLVRGSRPAWDAVNAASAAAGAALTVIVVILIIRHWRSARGWSRQAMVPLVWIALVIGVESLVSNVTGQFRLPPLANLVFNGWAPLVYMLGPVLFVISTVRARTARGALGTAIVDLEPGAPPGRLRDTLARALGDSTLQLAFLGQDGFTDTARHAVDPARPDPGRAVVPLAGAQEAVLVCDAGLELEPHLVRLTAAAASMARSTPGCRPRSRRSWSWSGRPGPGSWRPGTPNAAGSSGTCAQLLQLVAVQRPAVVLADIRMPPTQTTEGLEAAVEIRRRWPGTAVIVLSQHVETEHLFELLAGDARGIGYVLKERVADIAQ